MTIAISTFRGWFPLGLTVAVVLAGVGLFDPAIAQQGAVTVPKPKQKKASELIRKQDPPRIAERVLEKATPQNVSIYVSLGKQRAFFLVDGETAIDTPISSGKRAGMTPTQDKLSGPASNMAPRSP